MRIKSVLSGRFKNRRWPVICDNVLQMADFARGRRLGSTREFWLILFYNKVNDNVSFQRAAILRHVISALRVLVTGDTLVSHAKGKVEIGASSRLG